MKHNKRLTAFYSLIQILYWMTYGLMFNFASAFLLDRGFSNSSIGLVLGASYALSACLQPAFAALFNHSGMRLSSAMACVYIPIALLSATLLILPLKGAALAAVVIGIFMLHSSMQPTLNSLHRGYELTGTPIHFSFARGVGSAAFSVMCALVGQLLKRRSPAILPALYLGTMLMLFVCLIAFRTPSFEAASREKQAARGSLLKRNPRFGLLLLGITCLASTHIFIDNFMLQIMRSVGGGSGHQGIAIAVAAVTELPAMVFYSWLRRRSKGNGILTAAAWIWAAKDFATLLARSPEAIYASELLQFFSYAFYVPAVVDYVASSLPREDYLKGQAFVGTAFTLGSLAATFIGGMLLDGLGVRGALGSMQVFSISGALLFTAALSGGKRKIS